MALLGNPIGRALIILVALAGLGAAWYLGSPLFISQTVMEKFRPSAGPDPAPRADGTAPGQATAGEVVLVAQGAFKDGDSFHKGEGTAKVYRMADGSHLLRLEGFKVTNGPDLHVLLAGNPAPRERQDLEQEKYYDLGKLKGNVGDQNYVVPSTVDLRLVRSVVIYCLPFHVVFSTASVAF